MSGPTLCCCAKSGAGGGHAPWSKLVSAALGAVCCSTAAVALLVLFPPALPAQAATGPAFGTLSSETEDKLLEIVRQLETRVGGAAGSFLPLGDEEVRECVQGG